MRRNYDLRETRCFWANARHNGQEIIVRMRAPGMRVRARWFRLLGPSCQAKRYHLPPRSEQLQVLVAHSHMVKRACEIETEVISGFGEGRHGSGCRVSVTHRKDFRKHIVMLFAGNHVEPDAENVRVLAVMF